jgi:formate hydrogenlyase subunit 4
MSPASLLHPALALTLSPLLLGFIQRTKAVIAGRKGPPLLQPYRDIAKLLRKDAVYSRTTTWLFRAGPIVGLSAALTATLLVPFGSAPALLPFEGDFILLACLLGTMRFLTLAAALDTGSSFEGMGASREAAFSALAEPALFLALAAVARTTGSLSLTGMFSGVSVDVWARTGPATALVAATLLVVFLSENARIPVDDPATHLELTMIHEVMILDHGGPDLAFIEYASALKLWILGALLTGLSLPVHGGNVLLDALASLAAMPALAILTGLIESSMARLKMNRVPQLLVGAAVLSAVALFLGLR